MAGIRDNGDSSVAERWTRDRKVSGSIPGRSGGIITFLLQCFYFGILSTPVLLQYQVKDPGHSAKSAGDRLHGLTHMHLYYVAPNSIADWCMFVRCTQNVR